MPEETRLGKVIATKSLENLTDGSTDSEKFSFKRDYHVDAILFNRDDGQPWTGSTCTIQVGRTYITEGSTPVSVFGTDWLTHLPVDIDLPAQEEVKVAVTNNEGTTITVYITLVMTPK